MKEIEAVGAGSFFHIVKKYVSDRGAEAGIKPQYSLRFAFDKSGDTFDALKQAARELNVPLNSTNMRLSDGNLVQLRDGTQPYQGLWLVDLNSRFPVPIVDVNAHDLKLDAEPGSGTKVRVAFRIGSSKKGDLVFFLTGVQIIDLVEGVAPHKFGVYTQGTVDDDEGDGFQ